MQSTFQQRWHSLRQEKQSNIVAGIDPAPYRMGRQGQGLPETEDLETWSISFVEAVAPYVAAIKLNQAYFQGVGQRSVIKAIVKHAQSLGLLVISDNKIADIGSTNDAWAYYTAEFGFDALTIAPYAGNIEDSISILHKRGLAAISMGLMSNPEFKTELHFINSETGEALWASRVRRALAAEVDGIVLGGTYHSTDEAFMEFVTMTKHSEALYLVPGIGAQGGEVEAFLASGIDPQRCMINSGRGLMFPMGPASTPDDQALVAKELRDQFNQIAYEN